ncbi:hypothetical protein B0S90_0201 [Caldicellulosiruptor bescii]|jgi:hypothetical protein|uniref:Uncharacterized protein n=3 Tax=Caldicellulosiruptor TaxID=44000 RepID=B9MPY0_CALBD|nr:MULTISPECIES: hypothetical protein [Caldicellulosiruptor]ACM61763.1 hypothetical protein Athe_2709 [Caldicellulosiruptor bescii DSM 6725]ADQ08257.1 conserved hypothetical protein [Caldicellulosiruptor hydrothermalis 108]PBC88437.1 hypothetical protein B0S87_1424 [Caldicellulosiruptor bescii]PBC92082.1 hypothetical protein B0S89_2569 [Caldicellulosiruptor bescii]PBD02502.1 hypothetical protein B0S85_0006 [Caldicellulosiruptor bescii]
MVYEVTYNNSRLVFEGKEINYFKILEALDKLRDLRDYIELFYTEYSGLPLTSLPYDVLLDIFTNYLDFIGVQIKVIGR